LAHAIRGLVRAEARGILNITNSGSCSWFDFAKEIVQRAGRNTPVIPITSTEAGRLAKRPAYSVLSPKALSLHGIAMRTWQEALNAYLLELRSRRNLN
jgi:dTDP-4-dehydrorhamnose reductase